MSGKPAFSPDERIHPDLPVFRLDFEEIAVLYVPPAELAAVDLETAGAIERAWKTGAALSGDHLAEAAAAHLLEKARNALDLRRRLLEQPFEPECLTLVPVAACNLDCQYCYSRSARSAGRAGIIDEAAASAAADLVAENCRKKGLPFNLAVHGGGEPTLFFELLERLVGLTGSTAARHGLGWTGYLAFNGLVSEKQARRLAALINRAGLSCDGPPDIQNRQRPAPSGQPSSRRMERAARAFIEAGGALAARSTITPATRDRQVEIVEYLVMELGVRDIRFEPVFVAGEQGFAPDDARAFASGFLAARARAASLGAALSYSGVRLDELHGPFCETSRNVLRLVPGNWASACFLPPEVHGLTGSGLKIGGLDNLGRLVMDERGINHFRRTAERLPDECRNCFISYHCSRGCPDHCSAFPGTSPAGGFRCRVNRILARDLIREAALGLPEDAAAIEIVDNGRSADEEKIIGFLKNAPSWVEPEEILTGFRVISNWHDPSESRQPSPPWERRDWSCTGPEAWRAINKLFRSDQGAPVFSVYVHIPFCEERCGFCDCRAVRLVEPGGRLEAGFVETLINEIKAWGESVSRGGRSVSTVHFGGGSPDWLSNSGFERILTAIRDNLPVAPETEWAIEAAGRSLTAARLDRLARLGFSRLHVGVQTLDDPIRMVLGRRETGAEIVNRIKIALTMGFVTSGDLICGLPGQNLDSWLDTLVRLREIDISGLSLYRFNISRRNAAFVQSRGEWSPDPIFDYVLFQAGMRYLLKSGYGIRYYNHLALPEDLNLYFTSPGRGEDLLALGPTADGVIAGFQYRSPGLGPYRRAARDPENPAGLEGGGFIPDHERAASPLLAGLWNGRVERRVLEPPEFSRLAGRWLDLGLIAPAAGPDGAMDLTPNGAWRLDRMIADVETARPGPHGKNA